MLGTLELELQGAGSYPIDMDSELWSSETAASYLSSPSFIFLSVHSPGGHLNSKEPAENKGLQRVDTESAVMRLNCPPASE